MPALCASLFALRPLLFALLPLPTAYCSLLTDLCTLPFALCSLLFPFTIYDSRFTDDCPFPFALCSWLLALRRLIRNSQSALERLLTAALLAVRRLPSLSSVHCVILRREFRL